MSTCRVNDRIFSKRNSLKTSYYISDAGSEDDLLEWYPSQVKGPVDDEVQEGKSPKRKRFFLLIKRFFLADLISTIEFNEDGELLAVGDKGGRIVIFQREQQVIIREKK